MKAVPEIFGSDVFNEATMRQRLKSEVFDAWKNCILTASPLPKYSPITLRQQSFPSFHPLFTALRLCLGLLNLSSLSRLSPISTFPMLSSAI